MADVVHELSPQVGDRREYTARNDVALDFGKPELDLVEPGGIGRSEMQVNLGMSSQKVVDLSGLMGGEVVGDHVDLFAVLPSTSPVLVSNAAYRDSVPCRTYSKPCRSARPGEGNTGSLRSSA